tara:strand:+ start:156 stop:1076 length:921 start_codon:yes stop_codon:yes gene_type:complete
MARRLVPASQGAVSGGPSYSASAAGVTVPSGVLPPASVGTVPGPSKGPWAITTQSLNIEGRRMPRGYVKTQDASLSAASGTYTFNGTWVPAIITANRSLVKSYDAYTTSSFQQGQKFEIIAQSADGDGFAYGTVGSGCLGPFPKVVTNQEYYNRIPWDDSLHTEFTSGVECANFALVTSAYGNMQSHDQHEYMSESNAATFMWPLQKGSFLNPSDKHIITPQGGGPGYYIWGPYNTEKETMSQIISWIDSIATHLSKLPYTDKAWYYYSTGTLASIPGNVDIDHGNTVIADDTGLMNYDKSVHDFT